MPLGLEMLQCVYVRRTSPPQAAEQVESGLIGMEDIRWLCTPVFAILEVAVEAWKIHLQRHTLRPGRAFIPCSFRACKAATNMSKSLRLAEFSATVRIAFGVIELR